MFGRRRIQLPKVNLTNKTVIDRKFINTLLSVDEIRRGNNGNAGWRLHTGEDLVNLMNLFIEQYVLGDECAILGFHYGGYGKVPRTPTKIHATLLLHRFATPECNFKHDDDDGIQFERNYLSMNVLTLGKGKLLLAGSGALRLFEKRAGREFKANGHYPTHNSDFDFFFVGYDGSPDSKKDAEIIIRETRDYFENLTRKPVLMIRSSHAITMQVMDDYHKITIQFILRLYPETGDTERNISMVLGGFDLYYCAIGLHYTPHDKMFKFYSTTTGAFCIAQKLNIANTGRLSESYAYRNKKYCSRGVNLIVPQMTKEDALKTIDTERCGFFTTMKPENVVLSFKIPKICAPNKYIHRDSDYDSVQSSENWDLEDNVYVFDSSNARALITGRIHNYVRTSTDIDQLIYGPKDFFNRRLCLNQFFMHLHSDKDSYRLEMATYSTSVYYNTRVSYANKYCPLEEWRIINDDAEFAEEKLIVANATNIRDRNKAGADLSIKAKTKAYDNMKKSFTKNDQCKRLCDLFKEGEIEFSAREESINNEMNKGLNWLTENPGTQQTATFHPQNVSPQDLFPPGLYRSFRIGLPDEIWFIIIQAASPYLPRSVIKQILIPYVARAWADGQDDLLTSPIYNPIN